MIGRFFQISWGPFVAAVTLGVSASGVLATLPLYWKIVSLMCIAIWFYFALNRRLKFDRPSVRAQRISAVVAAWPRLVELEFAFSMMAAMYALFSVSGLAQSPFYPLLYGVAAFSATLMPRMVTMTVVALGVLVELLWLPFGGWATAAMHSVFLLCAASSHWLFLRASAFMIARRQERETLRRLRQRNAEARDFRLISSALSHGARDRGEQESLLVQGSVTAIRDAVKRTVDVARTSLDADTVALLWLRDDGQTLHVQEVSTRLQDQVVLPKEIKPAGAISAVLRDRKATVLEPQTLKLPYYRGSRKCGWIGVPVLENGRLRGVFVADAIHADSALLTNGVQMLTVAGEQIVQIIQSEQVFLSVERSKYEHERFFEAASLLCRALTPHDVMQTAFDGAAMICKYEVAVFVVHDEKTNRHRVCASRFRGNGARMWRQEEIDNLEFRDNAGLASMVVKNRHYLPAGGAPRENMAPVFTERLPLRNAQSLLVMPLMHGETALGSVTLASTEPRAFGKDVREMLRVIMNQVAISLQNGVIYQRMEEMATTDGLTGLTNHRAFQERFEDLLERAKRLRAPVSLLLCDVDHFKGVNDTHGHPVGDRVLKKVAHVLRRATRRTDIPARYGGEEFAVVLDATDQKGALLLANRIREDVAAMLIQSEAGAFQVTMSVGVATYGVDGTHRKELIENADQALYHAKRTGRNRVVSFCESKRGAEVAS